MKLKYSPEVTLSCVAILFLLISIYVVNLDLENKWIALIFIIPGFVSMFAGMIIGFGKMGRDPYNDASGRKTV